MKTETEPNNHWFLTHLFPRHGDFEWEDMESVSRWIKLCIPIKGIDEIGDK